ncbi:hypothetical protein ACMFMF_001702 [Clarireedia jacksonii]
MPTKSSPWGSKLYIFPHGRRESTLKGFCSAGLKVKILLLLHVHAIFLCKDKGLELSRFSFSLLESSHPTQAGEHNLECCFLPFTPPRTEDAVMILQSATGR